MQIKIRIVKYNRTCTLNLTAQHKGDEHMQYIEIRKNSRIDWPERQTKDQRLTETKFKSNLTEIIRTNHRPDKYPSNVNETQFNFCSHTTLLNKLSKIPPSVLARGDVETGLV